jgi:hypothetical protein
MVLEARNSPRGARGDRFLSYTFVPIAETNIKGVDTSASYFRDTPLLAKMGVQYSERL